MLMQAANTHFVTVKPNAWSRASRVNTTTHDVANVARSAGPTYDFLNDIPTYDAASSMYPSVGKSGPTYDTASAAGARHNAVFDKPSVTMAHNDDEDFA